jgi:hypothetical protein
LIDSVHLLLFFTAGILNRITFSWVNRLLARGRKNKLKERFVLVQFSVFHCSFSDASALFGISDLELPNELKCHDQFNDFQENWEAEKQKPEPSLASALFKTYSPEIFQVSWSLIHQTQVKPQIGFSLSL